MDAGARRLIDYERAVPEVEHPREAAVSPLIRCKRCHLPIAVVAGEQVIARHRGREFMGARPMRIVCDCGAVNRVT
jgi:hypothetical protein